MENSKGQVELPNSLRCFLAQKLLNFTPWHFIQSVAEYEFASAAFDIEDVKSRKVFVFASRQDCDDFAGLEIIRGSITENVIVFHPVFGESGAGRQWDIVNTEYKDIFEFMSSTVMPDMRDWFATEDAEEL